MNRKQLRSMKVTCSRCKRLVRGDKADGWNIEAKQGRFVGHICPTCQTPEENAEAEINEATLDYSKARGDSFGRLSAPAKVQIVLTEAIAAEMSAKDLIVACAEQIEQQHPDADEKQSERLKLGLYTQLSTDRHTEEFAEMVMREQFEEASERVATLTAEHLACPLVNENDQLRGVINYRGDDGEHMVVSLQFATVESFERPWHLHTREYYLPVAALLRKHGLKTYRDAYVAGVLGELLDDGEPHAS